MRALLIFLITIVATGPALADTATCQALFRAAPSTLAGHKLTNRINYEAKSPGAGYHLRYARKPAQLVSVYFYDRGQNRFDETALATELSVTTSQVFRMRSEDRNVTDGKVYFDKPDETIPGLFGLGFVHLEYDNRTLQHDYITLGVAKGCLVKVIYSSPGARFLASRRFNRVLDAVLAFVGRVR